MNELLDEVLTLIERHEAQQMRYGLYDTLLTGDEVFNRFSSVPEQGVRAALDDLHERALIIRFEDRTDHQDWVFRSRTAETVRLMSNLRQRRVNSKREKSIHRADRSPHLVHDLKFEIRRRHVPGRNRPVADLTASIRDRDDPALEKAADILETLFAQTEFSGFQQRAFDGIADHLLLQPQHSPNEGMVITADTGAGKTYASFLPTLAYCIAEKGVRCRSGVKAICLYPRVALSEDQLETFVQLIYRVNQHLPSDQAVTVGIDSGASPYTLGDFQKPDDDYLQNRRGWRWDERNSRYVCPFAHCPACNGQLAVQQTAPERIFCVECGESHPCILYAKEQFRTAPPDVLLATTESLNNRLMNSRYQMLFGDPDFPPPAVVMLDEIHLQSSTKGSQIALLLRRLATRLRQTREEHAHVPRLMTVGLSATIAQPRAFFSDLTGLTSSAITLVEPQEDELEAAGAENYLFVRAEQEEDTAVISTLLQTAMAVVHSMPLPSPEEQADGIDKYKTFGFAQSLDIVGRWLYQLTDAEKMNEDDIAARRGSSSPKYWPIGHTPLYWYRTPGHNRRLFPSFFGRPVDTEACERCIERGYPDLKCVYFQEGECWWTLYEGLRDPMRIKRKTAADRQVSIEDDDDLIITTSALEVGYDDPSIMGVIQYQSPSNVASFVQRKGRGGRKVGTRPLITTVLSPHKTSDVFLYQNHHLLVAPRFDKLPLNPGNVFLQRIHGFYALFDWLAYFAARQELSLRLGNYMDEEHYAALKRLTAQSEVLDGFRDYLSRAFDLRDPSHTQMLLVDPGAHSLNDSGILTRGLSTLMEALHQAHDIEHSGSVAARREVLRDYLPQNLFSDINLPELNVHYGHRDRPTAEDIALALTETIPGNVTFRGGGGSSWIAPPLGSGAVFILEDAYTLSGQRRHEAVLDMRKVPERVRRLMDIRGRVQRELIMIRPLAVGLQRFGDRDGSQWWFDGSSKPGELLSPRPEERPPVGSNIRQVRHASSGYPISFTQIEHLEMVGRRFSFVPGDHAELFNDLGQALFNRIDFASDADNGNLMDVRRVIVGSQYSMKLRGADAPVENVVTFARREAPDELTAIGYEMQTEGILFKLSDLDPDEWSVSRPTAARLQRNFVKHAVVTELSAQPDVNYFAAERFAEVMLTIADLWTKNRGWPEEKFEEVLCAKEDKIHTALEWAIGDVYHLSRKNTEAVTRIFNQSGARKVFANCYNEMHSGGPRYTQYLEDTFVHTLKHALKQTAQNLAGVEAMQYVAGYTLLNMDFGELRDRPVWLYELGMGGVGVMRSVQDVLRDDPSRFWTIFETTLEHCGVEEEDRFLLNILALPEDVLETLHECVGRLQAARSSTERETALRELRDVLQQARGFPPQHGQIKSLLRIFSDDYTGREGFLNWKLYRELNRQWVPNLTERLGRLPTRTEVRGLLHYALTHPNEKRQEEEQAAYPELTRLLELYESEYEGDDIRQVFENVVGRRLLLNCRDVCPTCLDEGPGCQIDPPGLSTLTLSRALVNEVLWDIRQARTVSCTNETSTSDLANEVETLFQEDLNSPVILTGAIDLPEPLAALVSHLTDYGIVDRLERRYPRIDRARTLDGKVYLWLTLARER